MRRAEETQEISSIVNHTIYLLDDNENVMRSSGDTDGDTHLQSARVALLVIRTGLLIHIHAHTIKAVMAQGLMNLACRNEMADMYLSEKDFMAVKKV